MTRCWCDGQQKQHMLSVLSKNSQRERYLHRYPIGNFIWRDIRSCSCNRSCNCKPPYNLKYKRIHRAYAGRLAPPANPPVPHGGHTRKKRKERRDDEYENTRLSGDGVSPRDFSCMFRAGKRTETRMLFSGPERGPAGALPAGMGECKERGCRRSQGHLEGFTGVRRPGSLPRTQKGQATTVA